MKSFKVALKFKKTSIKLVRFGRTFQRLTLVLYNWKLASSPLPTYFQCLVDCCLCILWHRFSLEPCVTVSGEFGTTDTRSILGSCSCSRIANNNLLKYGSDCESHKYVPFKTNLNISQVYFLLVSQNVHRHSSAPPHESILCL